MRNRKTRIIIGVLVGLIFFSSSIALLMYSKQNDLSQYVEEHIEAYVTTKHLFRGDLIGPSDIEKAFLPKSYLSFAPLTKSEIVGRYANVEIFTKEPIRKEKISQSEPIDEKPVVIIQKVEVKKDTKKTEDEIPEIVATKDTITLSMSMFKNIDGTLKVGDHIDILSVIPVAGKSKEFQYTTKYVALNVKINTFISRSQKIRQYILKGEKSTTLADSIVFEMAPKEIEKFLSLYYSVGQLWMVRCSPESTKNDEKVKNAMLVKKRVVRKTRARVTGVSISYEQ